MEIGDEIMVYTSKGSGSNYRGTITQKDDSDNTIYVSVRRDRGNQPHRSTGWYKPRISKRGIPYVREADKL